MENKRLTNTERAQKTSASFDQIEALRVDNVQNVKADQEYQQVALARERKRMALKYGEQDSRVVAIDKRLNNGPLIIKALDEQEARISAKPTNTPSDTWTVYGTVRDANYNRFGGSTVAFYREDGQRVKDLGYDCTNDKGFYKIGVKDEDGSLAEKYKDTPLYMGVSDKEREVLYKDNNAVYLDPSRSDNREIVIPDFHCDLPPDEIPDTGEPEYLIEGTITNKNGKPIDGLSVRAVDQDFTGENPLGEAVTTDSKGFYRIPYKAEDFIIEGKETGGADIILYISDPNGKLIYTSEPYRNSPKYVRIDLKIESIKE
ncbi:MAG: carboxypeptidase-like regulatory domain-containing protein [Chitinophagales bacterium]|nr:carboxypeptidase-like regulatory domain-containing protein [Chitinophagales bacterium]